MKTFLAILIALIFLLPVTASAHGGGPPFVVVNGEYAETNTLSALAPQKIAQDGLKKTFVVGQPVEFKIDEPALGFVADARWSWARGSQDYQEGKQVNHTFNKVGSHWVLLQLRAPSTSNQWADYDTIQVNVVPKQGYELPNAKVSVVTRKTGGSHRTTISTIPSGSAKITSYDWMLGDGSTAIGATVKHDYPLYLIRIFPILIITDTNGLQANTAFQLDDSRGPLTASSVDFLPGVVLPTKPDGLLLSVAAGLGIIVFGAILFAPRLWRRWVLKNVKVDNTVPKQ